MLPALALLAAPALGALPGGGDDPKSCVAVAGVAVDDEWCRSSCGATTPNCPASVCVCGDQAKQAVLAVPAAVPAAAPDAAVPEESAAAQAAPDEAAAQAEPVAAAKRTFAPELLGYLENWNDVVWWDNGIPHNCLQGCFQAKKMLNATAPYSAINYGFIFFTNKPSADQHNCQATKNLTQAQVCPAWDGKALYMSKKSKDGSHAIDAETTLDNMTAGLVAIAETVRLGRMHPAGPKRVKIAVGGWSDYSRFGSAKGAKAAAALAAKAVQYTFADGIDIDLEHMTDIASIPVQGEGNEYGYLAAFIQALRAELDDVAIHWRGTAKARKAALQRQFAEMDEWSQEAFGAYVNTSLQYIDEVANPNPNPNCNRNRNRSPNPNPHPHSHPNPNQVASNPVPHLEISWTTRFNAFVPDHDSFNYVKKWIRGQPKKNSAPYGSDNEGTRLWPATVLTSSSRAAAAPCVRATRTRLLRRVRTRGTGQLGPRRHAPSRMYRLILAAHITCWVRVPASGVPDIPRTVAPQAAHRGVRGHGEHHGVRRGEHHLRPREDPAELRRARRAQGEGSR